MASVPGHADTYEAAIAKLEADGAGPAVVAAFRRRLEQLADPAAGLLPGDANARARAITWMFAALNSVEPSILEFATARIFESDKPWYEARLPIVMDRVRGRLNQLSARLGDADWLDGAFSAGDLMMVSVLRTLKTSGILSEFPNLAAYVARGEARRFSVRRAARNREYRALIGFFVAFALLALRLR